MEKFAECVQDSEQLKSVLLDMKVPRSNTMLGCEISHSLLVFYDLQNNKIVSIKRNIVDIKNHSTLYRLLLLFSSYKIIPLVEISHK